MQSIISENSNTDVQQKQTRLHEINEFAEKNHRTHPEECFTLMIEAEAICREINDNPGLIKSLHRQAFSLRALVRFQESISVLESAIEISMKNHSIAEVAKLKKELGQIHLQIENFDEARKALINVRMIYGELGLHEDEVSTINDLSNIEISQGDLSEALHYCQDAFLICEKENIEPPPVLWHNLGAIYASVGDTQKALESYLRAIEAYRKTGDNIYEAGTLDGIGILYWQNNELELACKYLVAAVEHHKRFRNPDEKISIISNLAQLLIVLNRLDEAGKYIKQAYDVLRDKEFPAAMVPVYRVHAIYEKATGNFVKAEYLFNKALLILEKNENYTYRIDILLEKSTLHKRIKKETILLQALEFAQLTGRKSALPEIYYALYEHYHDSGKLRSALNYHRLFHNVKQEILTEKSAMQLKVLHVQNKMAEIQKDAENSKIKLTEMTDDVIQKNQVLSQIRNHTQKALLQQGFSQKKILHEIVRIAESGASSFWTQLEERSKLIDGNLSEKMLKICPDLTTIQLRIILLIKERMSNKEIGKLLFLTDKSIEYHRTIIRKKLHLKRTESINAFLANL